MPKSKIGVNGGWGREMFSWKKNENSDFRFWPSVHKIHFLLDRFNYIFSFVRWILWKSSLFSKVKSNSNHFITIINNDNQAALFFSGLDYFLVDCWGRDLIKVYEAIFEVAKYSEGLNESYQLLFSQNNIDTVNIIEINWFGIPLRFFSSPNSKF